MISYHNIPYFYSAGPEQEHTVINAFKVLRNEGFLRDHQGVLSLEVVQEFYKIIQEPLRKAKFGIIDLSRCQHGKYTPKYQAVISLVKEESEEDFLEDSQTNVLSHRAVVVSK